MAGLLTASPPVKGPPSGENRKACHDRHHQPEPVLVFGERHAPNVHAENPRDYIDRQRQHGDQRQREERAVALLVHPRGDLFLQQLDAFDQTRQIAQHQRKFLGGVAQILKVERLQPAWRPRQQPENRSRFRREQTLQPDQHTSRRTEFRAGGGGAHRKKTVLYCVDINTRAPDDLYQQIGLVTQQMNEQLSGGQEDLAVAYRFPQRIDGAQWFQPRRDEQFFARVDP